MDARPPFRPRQGRATPWISQFEKPGCLRVWAVGYSKLSRVGVITSHGKHRLPCADVEGGMRVRFVPPKQNLQDVGSTHYLQARNRLARRAWHPRSAPCRSRTGPAGAMKIIWMFVHVGVTFGHRQNEGPTVLRVSLLCGRTIGIGSAIGIVPELHEDLSA